MKTSIVVAVGDPILHPEVLHIVAAAGQQIIDVTSADELRRVAGRGRAVVVDKLMATELGGALKHPRVLFVAGDPGPIDWQRAFQVGAAEGFVVPAQAPELLRAVGEAPELQETGRAVGVLGASGGCGASTVAVGIARELGGATLIDADPFSGGIDLLLGAENALGARWNDLGLAKGNLDSSALKAALPQDEGLHFLTSTRGDGSLEAVTASQVQAAVTALTSEVVVDVSLRLQNWQDVVSTLPAVVLVVPAELRAVSAARSISGAVMATQGPALFAVVRHRGWSGLSVSEVERLAGVEVLAEIPHSTALVKRAEMHGLESCPRALKPAVATILHEVG